MSKYDIRTMKPEELKHFYEHIERDFSPDEYAPYDVLYHQLQSGIQLGLVLCKNGLDLAYVICAANDTNGYVLISLLAVFEQYRGRGIGSEFMKAINEMYIDKQGILVEVEKPEISQTQEEHVSRIRRIAFYEKLGYHLVSGIDYSIWDVPMHIMAKPLQANSDTIRKNIGKIMYEIYLQLMGKRFIHKLQLKEVEEGR